MQVTAVKTKKIHVGDNLYQILDKFLPTIQEGTVIAIVSKIISLCQRNVIKYDPSIDKKNLIKEEADLYNLDNTWLYRDYRTITTIKNNTLIQSAGIDESNGDGYYVLWPKKLQQTTNTIWKYLRKKNNLTKIGVIVTDGRTTPLRWGVTGMCLTWCGFKPLKRYIGKPDVFGRIMHNTNGSIIDGLASAASVVMGEGSEQTPLGIITDIPFVHFVSHPPTKSEIQSLKIDIKHDVYAPLLASVTWKSKKDNPKI